MYKNPWEIVKILTITFFACRVKRKAHQQQQLDVKVENLKIEFSYE